MHTPDQTDSPTVNAEIASGQGISLSAAARRIPPGRNDKPISPSTLWRWAREGVSLPGGGRAYLEVARLGCRWLTSQAALQRFLDAQGAHLDAVRQGRPQFTPNRPPARTAGRTRQVQAAQAELTKLGI